MKGLTVLSLVVFFAGYAVAQNVTTKTLANGTVIEYIEYTDYTEYTYYDDPTITSTSSDHVLGKPDLVGNLHVNRNSDHVFGKPDLIGNLHVNRNSDHIFRKPDLVRIFHVNRNADYVLGKPDLVRIFHVNRRSDRNDHNHNRWAEYRCGITNVHVVWIADYRNGRQGRPEVDEEIRSWRIPYNRSRAIRKSICYENIFNEGIWRKIQGIPSTSSNDEGLSRSSSIDGISEAGYDEGLWRTLFGIPWSFTFGWINAIDHPDIYWNGRRKEINRKPNRNQNCRSQGIQRIFLIFLESSILWIKRR
ncbi:hypothetical protein pipiens_002228 [Culex pipiens pipiens]|uniref:Uncharacterized protein n=1 Tax=Culex pipiens pipiens TaxID=38569 RepID=A0ABD1DHT9_CULPP